MASTISGSSFAATSLRSQSEMYMSMVGAKGVVRSQNFREKLQEFKDFVFNRATGKIFNRSPGDWLVFILLHCCVVFGAVAMSALLLGVFYTWLLDWNQPSLQSQDALVHTPGMAFRPQPHYMSNLIRFVKGDKRTYITYMDDLEAYLRYYENENQEGENYIDCSTMTTRSKEDIDKVCRFNMEFLGADCVKQQDFGFDDGQPCVLLKLNKVYNWVPEVDYNTSLSRADVLPAIRVECQGETATDQENMGTVRYFPPEGFAIKYFPFRNQQGFRSPLVFARFENATPGVLIMVTCRAIANNIQHSQYDMAGRTHFELLID